MAKRKPTRQKKLFYALVALVLLVVVVCALELTNTTHWFHKSVPVSKTTAPIQGLPAQTSSNGTTKQPTSPSSVNQQTDTDKHGQAPSTAVNDPSKWLVSQSGVITVKTPSSGATFSSGDELYGSASVNQVQYRLVDNQVGVVSQGFISVVNGNFTASINFKAYGGNGRLDVFSTDPTGKELNEVQVPLNF